MHKPQGQIGASERGPGELDRAKKNRGLPKDAVTITDEDEEALAEGKTVEERKRTERQAAAGQQARQPKRPTEEPVPRPADENEHKPR